VPSDNSPSRCRFAAQLDSGLGCRNRRALGGGHSRLIGAAVSLRADVALGGGSDNAAGVGMNVGW